VTHHDGKDAVPERAEKESPDPPASAQTPFQRFEEFARKVVSVPRSEMDERERAYRDQHPKKVPG
jgi:hypothetical protein